MKHLAFALALFLAASCGKPSKQSRKRGVYIENLNATPIELFKEYPRCEGSEAESDSTFFELIQFLSGRALNRELDMESSLSGGELRSANKVAQTYFGGAMMLEERVRNGYLIGAQFLITEQPSSMNVCPGVKSYQRYSYENASLNANYSINKTIRKLEQAGFMTEHPVKVYVSPFTVRRLIRETSDRIYKEDSRITDNAFYLPHLKAVIFVPQSEESRDGDSFGNVPLWEVPMVGSHEYGHHVFHSIMKSARGELVNRFEPCFKTKPRQALKSEQASAFKSSAFSPVGVGKVLGSLNEGFADLVAFYTLDNTERGLKGVNCMETNREVGSPIFANNDQKLFNQNALNGFFDPFPQRSGGCYTPAYHEIHIMGAIFASVSDRLMNSFRLNKQAKLATLLEWLEALNQNHRRFSSLGPKKYLGKAYALMAAQILESSRQEPGSWQCDTIERFAPKLDSIQEELERIGC